MNLLSRSAQGALVRTVLEGMRMVRQSQGGQLLNSSGIGIKDDETLVTVTDRRSQGAMTLLLKEKFPEIPIWGEEDAREKRDGNFLLLVDPLDGTRAFTSGLATSTVIVGVYDTARKKVVCCLVGEAATNRIWSVFETLPTRLSNLGSVSVWSKGLDGQSTVFLDVSHGFTREGRRILTDGQVARIFTGLNSQVRLFIPGSNGLIQALVANGGQGVVGSVTTAIGGPWDVAGVLLVKNAGGSARAFSVERDRGFTLVERDPLDVMSYDILICGNSEKTVEFLS